MEKSEKTDLDYGRAPQGMEKPRNGLPGQDLRWNLEELFTGREQWDSDLQRFQELDIPAYLRNSRMESSPADLLDASRMLFFARDLLERLELYAFLEAAADLTDSGGQDMSETIAGIRSRAEPNLAELELRIVRVPEEAFAAACLKEPHLEQYRSAITKLKRRRNPETTGEEERLIALHTEVGETLVKAFFSLIDSDIDFGRIQGTAGIEVLTRSNLSRFMLNPDRTVRKQAYRRFLEGISKHEHTLAVLLSGRVRTARMKALIRGYPSVRSFVLRPEGIPESVCSSLFAEVRRRAALFHAYYEIKRIRLGLKRLKLYDISVPLFSSPTASNLPFPLAVELVAESVSVLGGECGDLVRSGFPGGMADPLPRAGKRGGAFTAAVGTAGPYVLLNYKPDVPRSLMTLAHEAGHALHFYFSRQANAAHDFLPSVLESETAANLAEQLVRERLLELSGIGASSKARRLFLLEQEMEDFTAKMLRQTMLAEVEHSLYSDAAAGEPLTLDHMRNRYLERAEEYYGPAVELDPEDGLGILTVPHLYDPYYMYTYPLAAAAARHLTEACTGPSVPAAVERCRALLSSGGRLSPVESLKLAGVSLEKPETITAAFDRFERLLEVFSVAGRHS